jgi:hypothetical protein
VFGVWEANERYLWFVWGFKRDSFEGLSRSSIQFHWIYLRFYGYTLMRCRWLMV